MIVEKDKKDKKVFTKSESNNIIRKDYDPLKVNYKMIYEREGLCMKGIKNVISNEEMNRLIINKKDFKEIFNCKKKIRRDEYEEYLKVKNYT